MAVEREPPSSDTVPDAEICQINIEMEPLESESGKYYYRSFQSAMIVHVKFLFNCWLVYWPWFYYNYINVNGIRRRKNNNDFLLCIIFIHFIQFLCLLFVFDWTYWVSFIFCQFYFSVCFYIVFFFRDNTW